MPKTVKRSGLQLLFDQSGLPYTSRLRWGLLQFWVAAVFIFLAPLVGIYVGLWLVSKSRSYLPLFLYLALTVLLAVAAFAPFPIHGTLSLSAPVLGAVILLWLVSSFALRHSVVRYYSDREGVQFLLNPALTALFGSWYVGGQLRADFPLATSGKTGAGVMRLIV